MTLQIDHALVQALGGDEALAGAVAAFTQARADHAFTVDVPAPTAHPIVEEIVRRHDGQYEITNVPEPEPEPVDPSTLPLNLVRAASARLTVDGWDVTGIERSEGIAGAFVVDTDVVWVFFATEQPDTSYVLMPSEEGFTKFTDHVEVTRPGLADLSFIIFRVQ